MPNTLQCLNTDQLCRLSQGLADDLEQVGLIQHLDNCSGCQRALEALAGGGYTVPAPGECTLPPADSAFWPALQQVRDDADPFAVTTQVLAVGSWSCLRGSERA